VDNLLGQLMGGGQKQDFEDFTRRYDQGAPWDGFDDDEARDKYGRVAPNLSPDLYRESAEEAFERLTPDQRFELGRRLQESARREGVSFDADGDGLRDSGSLARATSRIQQERPGLLEQILGAGSGGGGMLGGGIGKAALGGIAAIAVQKMMSGRR
jgi:hypothetical protein